MAEYWIERDNLRNAIREYEQFCQVPEERKEMPPDENHLRLAKELERCYVQLLIQPSEEMYIDIMQLYTDMGEYRKAAYFWEIKAKYTQERHTEIHPDSGSGKEAEEKASGALTEEAVKSAAETSGSMEGAVKTTIETAEMLKGINIQEYMDLFAGREDTYVKETAGNANARQTEQVMEPLTEEAVRQHLSGNVILGTYV